MPEKRGFGMVFQNYALFPHLTVFDNVAFGLSLQRKPAAEIKERVGTMLGLVRLPVTKSAIPGNYLAVSNSVWRSHARSFCIRV